MAAPFVVARRGEPRPVSVETPGASVAVAATPPVVRAEATSPEVMRPFDRVLEDPSVTDLFVSAARGLHVAVYDTDGSAASAAQHPNASYVGSSQPSAVESKRENSIQMCF